jgi:hypothetical protein
MTLQQSKCRLAASILAINSAAGEISAKRNRFDHFTKDQTMTLFDLGIATDDNNISSSPIKVSNKNRQ